MKVFIIDNLLYKYMKYIIVKINLIRIIFNYQCNPKLMNILSNRILTSEFHQNLYFFFLEYKDLNINIGMVIEEFFNIQLISKIKAYFHLKNNLKLHNAYFLFLFYNISDFKLTNL